MSLKGRHALVTGGGTGIGAAIALALANEGADVTITGRREDALATHAKSSPKLHPRVMDVNDEDSINKATAAAAALHGPITICVANAGIAEGMPFLKTTLTDWQKIMRTNLDGAFLTIRSCLAQMQGEAWGRIIGISSIAGLKGLKGAAAYTASKHGLLGLIRALSEEYLGTGLTFNALCPGYVNTAIIDQNAERISTRMGKSTEEARALMAAGNRHGRLIEPEEVAAAAIWLCSPRSGSVNGQAIEIAGGQF